MIIRPMQESDTEGGFCSGRPALDTFYAKRAWSHEQTHVSRVYVAQQQDVSEGRGR